MKKAFLIIILALGCATILNAETLDYKPLFTLPLYPDGPTTTNGYSPEDEATTASGNISGISSPRIDFYRPATLEEVPVLLVCPGGGYHYVSSDNEGTRVAKFMVEKRVAVAVLKYRMPNGHDSIPLADARRAMCLLRDSAGAWNVNRDKIGVMGFSAGGHLAASLVTKYTNAKERPDYGVLVYPVIDGDSAIWHRGSFKNLCGVPFSSEKLEEWSISHHVTEQTPPCFLVACEDDATVPVENSIRMYRALRDKHVRTTMLLMPEGRHGWGFTRQFPNRDVVETAMMEFIYENVNLPNRATANYIVNKLQVSSHNTLDWAKYARYEAQNDSVKALPYRPKAVFMGNSITDHWGNWRPEFFKANNVCSRGISGQSTYQMLARFQADVTDLHPKKVFILAGTNDIACNDGYISDEHIVKNIISMCELAKANRIRPYICSILPMRFAPWNETVEIGNRIQHVNEMLREYARKNHITYVDYYSEFAEPDGSMKAELTYDGAHPDKEAYAIFERIVTPLIK